MATIFQRFGKIDDFVQGTGLGLTICRMLVEKMGGRIWVRSKQGKGTVFYFTLPVKR
ncbi:ATP-binding protein [Bacteroides fragilis]|nr:ATP-binding protein [Bacteroides hominis (ex Liu et al. 2022)]MCY6344220.1 ATP-binding protein [Bacteroides fragilis]MDV6205070.1 ATP-binding protein [Bacteroides hominis (ex Liu et al. 2022)]